MRAVLIISFAIATASCGAYADSAAQPPQTSADRHATVLIELFTSEGCSSCPPADDVLSDLIRNQPIPDVTIVGFGEHVDYWDNLGWRDVFSAPAFTDRQSDYEKQVFRTGSIYTPQAIVDGRFQLVGSDSAALRRAILNAAKVAKATLDLGVQMSGTSDLLAQITVNIPSELTVHAMDIEAVVVERNLATRVQRGENGGRLLKHGAVARTFVSAGAIKARERTFSKNLTLHVDSSWKRSDLQVVAFVQDRATKAIVGAAVGSPQGVTSGQ
ncbi:MAG TPA: DUF1223 domain-containing protein [Vicinamibacterales bacterium]